MARYTANRHFNIAQTFFISKNRVKNTSRVSISSIELYFLSKPKYNNNASGIRNPGITIYFAETENSIPTYLYNQFARVEYDKIRTSKNASKSTKFTFNSPIYCATDKEYAIIISYDGSENFIPWTSVKGDTLINGGISPGPSGPNIGMYYEWNNLLRTQATTSTDIGDITLSGNEEYLSGDKFVMNAWKPRNNTDLKFKIHGKRYAQSGTTVDADTSLQSNIDIEYTQSTFGTYETDKTRFALNMIPMEYIKYNKRTSIKRLEGLGGSRVYQNTVFYPGGYANSSSFITVSVTSGNNIITANTRYPNGTLFTWEDVFTGSGDEYIVVVSESHDAGQRKTNIRKVETISSNTLMYVDENFTITNSTAKFIKSPVGQLIYAGATKSFGKREELLVLRNSNANGSCRFVNNTIETTTINSGGTGYSNSDILYIIGYENVSGELQGGYRAEANLVTNTTGGITAIYFSNVGCGFTNSSNITAVYSNSTSNNYTSNTSAGSTANISFEAGSTLRTQYFLNTQYFKDCEIVNMPFSEVQPDIDILSDYGTNLKLYHQYHYNREITANTISGYRYRAIDDPTTTRKLVKNKKSNKIIATDIPVLMSRSNEYRALYSNGSYKIPANSAIRNVNNAFLIVDCYSNNDFNHPKLVNPMAKYSLNIINNDYTNEHKDQGNAFVRHITKQFKFARNAEDVIVYITAYKPEGSDIKIYTRLHHDEDTEDAFDDKDWTLLEANISGNVYSSLTNLNDYKEYQYTLPAFPNAEFTANGTVLTELSNNVLIGNSSSFNTEFANNDLIRIYDPLFPDTNWMISVVNTVTNSTYMTIDDLVSNTGVVGTVKIDKLEFPHQAFNNIQNDNVVRYYNSSMVNFDTFTSATVKIVLISNNVTIVPRVDDITMTGTST